MANRFEHPHPHSNIYSLARLYEEHGRIPWERITTNCNNFPVLDRQWIAELLTGHPNGPIDPRRPDVYAWLYYLSTLHELGDPFFERFFRGVYRERFEPTAHAAPPNRILHRPLSALCPLFFGIREEHIALGKVGNLLEEDTARDFSRFVIGVSFVSEPPQRRLKSVLSEFPFLRELADGDHVNEHNIEHALTNVNPEVIGTLLAYIRRDVSYRASGFLNILEEILAKRMTQIIAEGDHNTAWQRALHATHRMLYEPIIHVDHHVRGALEHLAHIPAPPAAAGQRERIRGIMKVAAEIASIFAGVVHVLEVLHILKRRGQAGAEGAPQGTNIPGRATGQGGGAETPPGAANSS